MAEAFDMGNEDNGTITVFVVFFFSFLLLLSGIVVDTGRQLYEDRQAEYEAQTAAVLGADSLSVSNLRIGNVIINPAKAIKNAENYMQSTGHPGLAWIKNGIVYTEVTYVIPSIFISMVGINSLTVSATGSATDLYGVNSGSLIQ